MFTGVVTQHPLLGISLSDDQDLLLIVASVLSQGGLTSGNPSKLSTAIHPRNQTEKQEKNLLDIAVLEGEEGSGTLLPCLW
jgi:hypothetical protein